MTEGGGKVTAAGKLDRGCSERLWGRHRGHPHPSRGSHVPPGQSREFVAGSWAPWPDPAAQWGREALGTEPRRGGSSRTAAASGDPRADAEIPARGSERGPGWILPPAGACVCGGSWAGGSSFKGHRQRAALTAAAADRPPLTQSAGERLGHLRPLPGGSRRHPGTARAGGPLFPLTLSSSHRRCCELGGQMSLCHLG